MLSAIMFVVGAVACAVLAGLLAYWEDTWYSRPLPDPRKPFSIINWISASHHWHSLGHYLMDFTITTHIFAFVTALAVCFLWMTGSLGNFGGWWLLGLDRSPMLYVAMTMVPACLITLVNELWNDGHWRFIVGGPAKDPEWKDFLFDLATHFVGALDAWFVILAVLEICRYEQILGVIKALVWGVPL